MTVATQQLEVVEPVVEAIAVDVMQRKRNGKPTPFGEATPFAHAPLQALVKEPYFQMVPTRAPADDQVILDRPF